MVCPNCGRTIPDGTLCPCSSGSPFFSSNPAVNLIKTIGASRQFLVMSVVYSVCVLLEILVSALGSADLSPLYHALANSGISVDALYDVLDAAENSSALGTVFGFIPSILTAAAMWIHYASCRNRLNGNLSTAGLTIWKVLRWIALAAICLMSILVLFLLAFIFIWGLGSQYMYGPEDLGFDGSQFLIVLFVVCAVFYLAVISLVLAYTISMVRLINRVKATALSGVADNRVSGFLIVMTYILAACDILTAFSMMFVSVSSTIVQFVSAVYLILMGLMLSKYRKGMTMLMYPPVQPVYPTRSVPQQFPYYPAPSQTPPAGPQPPKDI